MAHEVQRLSMAAAAGAATQARLTQKVTFTVNRCARGRDCMDGVRFEYFHDGRCADSLPLLSLKPADHTSYFGLDAGPCDSMAVVEVAA